MIWPFKKESNNFLGIDIGSSVIKIVEISREGDQIQLENYALLPVLPVVQKPSKRVKKDSLLFSPKEISEMLKTMLKEAELRNSRAYFSLPDFSTFFTTFSLPQMSVEEISQAVEFEARRHVPLALSEVTLGWRVVAGEISDAKSGELKILLVAVPNATIEQYSRVAELSGLKVLALEAEVFGLSRALENEIKKTTVLIDIGVQSTTASIIDNGTLKLSYSFDTAGNALTDRISAALNLDYEAAEKLKKEHGLIEGKPGVRQILLPMIDLILLEVRKTVENFYQQEGKEVQNYILAGGSSLMPGLLEYSAGFFGKETKLAYPFGKINYRRDLEKILHELGPSLSIATGMALKGTE